MEGGDSHGADDLCIEGQAFPREVVEGNQGEEVGWKDGGLSGEAF